MGFANPKEFEMYREDHAKKMEEKPSYKDPRIVNTIPENTYRFRLLFYVDAKHERKTPFIEKYVHAIWDEEAKKSDFVTCPTSKYLSGDMGFNNCPICSHASKMYKEHMKTQSVSCHEIYKKFKRQFFGYALVYVVNDPTNKDNNGTVKILKFKLGVSEFFEKEINGEKDKEGKIINDPVGYSAFSLTDGYDLILEVGKKDKWPSYAPKFSREKSSINIDAQKLEAEILALKFDEDFYTSSTKDALTKFFADYVLSADINSEVEAQIESQKIPVTMTSEVVSPNVLNSVKPAISTPTTTQTPIVVDSKDLQNANDAASSEFNVDDIIAEIENDMKK